MYPELFRVPLIDYPISSFGALMAIGFLVGMWVTARGMQEQGQDVEQASSLLVWCMVGGVLGSKLYFAIDNWLLGAGPFTTLFFARAGITWYGGLIGGTVAGIIGCGVHGLDRWKFSQAIAVGLPIGQSFGRVGCFLVGDDYGRPTDLPWGVAFPEGAPPTLEHVHPTQIYEIAWLLPVAALLWSRRKKSPFLFGEYFALNGVGRLVIEEWRVNPEVALGLTEPQWIGIALIAIGVVGWFYFRGAGKPAAA